jgi:hypothetical protein
MQIHCVDTVQSFQMLKQVLLIVTTVLKRVDSYVPRGLQYVETINKFCNDRNLHIIKTYFQLCSPSSLVKFSSLYACRIYLIAFTSIFISL